MAQFDKLGFLVKAPVPRTVELTGGTEALRYLAFMVDAYFAANPAVDNGEVDPAPADLLGAKREFIRQFREQGIDPSDWKI